jgi:hypothetical protein
MIPTSMDAYAFIVIVVDGPLQYRILLVSHARYIRSSQSPGDATENHSAQTAKDGTDHGTV